MSGFDDARAGFASAYASRVQPAIAALETRRILTFAGGGVFFLVSTMVGANISAALRGTFAEGLGVAFVFIGFAAGVAGPAYMLWKLHQALPRLFFEALARGLGFTPRADFPEMLRFQSLGLAPLKGQRMVQAVMGGEAEGRAVAAAIVQDSNGIGQSRATAYQGVLVAVPWGRTFPAQVILLREGWGGPPPGLQDIGLVDGRFERRFKVFGSDQVEARVLLDPVVIEEIVQFDEALGAPIMQCAFAGQGVYIAMRTVNLASGKDAWPRLWSPVNKPEIVRQLAWALYWARQAAILLRPAEAWLR